MVALLTLSISLMVLLQGGFFGLATCAVGILVCATAVAVWLGKAHRLEALPVVPLLFCCVAVLFLVSALAAGPSLTTLAETGAWATCAGVSFLAAAQGRDGRAWSLVALCWFGVATAVAGVFVYAGLLPLAGGMVEDRLQFTFQYANAAGAWYAVCALISLLSPDRRLRAITPVPATALLLTLSGGSLFAFLVVSVALGVVWVKRGDWKRLFGALFYGVCAAALFVTCRFAPIFGALTVTAALVLSLKFEGAIHERIAVAETRRWSIVLVCILGVSAVLGIALMHDRTADALRSVAERSCQVRDGLALWSSSSMLGVGPDNWQYLYPYIQTSVYYATVVHSSLVQLLLDVGLLGVALLIGACVLGLRGLWQDLKAAVEEKWSLATLCAVSFLLIHSLIEFDLQFSALACLLAFLLSGPSGPKVPKRQIGSFAFPKGYVAGALGLLVCLPLCGVGVLCTASSTALTIANQSGDYKECVRMFEGNSLAQADAAAQSEYLFAMYSLGDPALVTRCYERMLAPNDRDALYAAISYYRQDKTHEATQLLIERLETRPYDTAFLEGALKLAGKYGVDDAQRPRFDAAARNVESHADNAVV